MHLGDAEQALVLSEQVLARHHAMGASDAEAIVVRSLALSQLGRIDEALAAIEAVDVDDFPFGRSARALVRALADDPEGAQADAEAVEQAPGASYFDRSVACLGGVVAALRTDDAARRRHWFEQLRAIATSAGDTVFLGLTQALAREPANVPESLGSGWRRIVEQATAEPLSTRAEQLGGAWGSSGEPPLVERLAGDHETAAAAAFSSLGNLRFPSESRVAEVDAEFAGGEHRVAVERNGLHPLRRLGQRHVVDRRRVERHHHAVVAGGQPAHGGGAEAQPEDPVEGGRRAAAQQVAEDDGAGLLARQLLQPGGDLGAHAAQLLVLVDGLAEHRHAAPPSGTAPSATTTIENLAPRSSRWAIVAATGSRRNGISGMRMAWAPEAMPDWRAIHPA